MTSPLVDRVEDIHRRAIITLDWLRYDLRRGTATHLEETLNAVAWALEYPAHYVLDDLHLVEDDWSAGRGCNWST